MYEDKTYEQLLREKLALVSNALDKREGSIIYDALAPNSAESALIYIALDTIMNETFADTASRGYLAKRCAERGIVPYGATAAVGIAEFNIDVAIGSRFTCDKYSWAVTEKISGGRFYMQCETQGDAPNHYTGALIPIEYIDGLERASLTSIAINGEDEEATQDLRLRYLNSFNSQNYGFNRAQYISVVGALPGVGGVKVYRAWKGPGTVRVAITDSAFHAPSQTLVNSVQTAVDPTQNSGEGLGLAAIDHEVTVSGAVAVTINISAVLTFSAGWDINSCLPYIEAAIDDYCNEINATWADSETLVVRIAQIETRLLAVAGIVDIAGTTINSKANNLELGQDEIAARGGFISA